MKDRADSADGPDDVPQLSFVQRLHDIWSHQAPPSAYAKLRDSLLSHQDQLETNIVTLCSVAKIACPDGLTGDTQWQKLLLLAGHIEGEGDAKTRKRVSNAATRLRSLALIATLWSPQVVFYYGWDRVGQVQMSAIRACAIQYPRFREDLAPRLNCLLLQRHCSGITNRRCKTLVEAPLQPSRDLNVQLLAAITPDYHAIQQWITSEDGDVAIDEDGSLLSEIRPNHYRMYLLRIDRYGLLAARTGVAVSCTADDAPWDCEGVSTWFASSRDGSGSSSRNPSYAGSSDISLFSAPAGTETDTDASSLTSPEAYDRETLIESEETNVERPHCQQQSILASEPGSGFDATSHIDPPTCSLSSRDPANLLRRASLTPSRITSTMSDAQPSMCQTDQICNDPGNTIMDEGFQRNPNDFIHAASQVGAQSTTSLSYDSLLHYLEPQATHTTNDANHVSRSNGSMPYTPDGSGSTSSITSDLQTPHGTWLRSDARWASIFTQAGSVLPRGEARSEDEAEVLFYTSEEFIWFARQGHIFSKPIVIKEQFSDANMHTAEVLALQLHDRSVQSSLDVRRLDTTQPMRISPETIAEGLCIGTPWDDAAVLSFKDVTKCHRPLLTMLPRFRLLDYLLERTMTETQQASSLLPGMDEMSTFNVCGFSSASSDVFSNSGSGAWIRVLDGEAIWMVGPEEHVTSEWPDHMEGNLPRDCKQRMILLEQDDVLLLPPGLKIMQAIHSLTTTVMECGLLWDEFNVLQTLQCIGSTLESPTSVQSVVSRQLSRIIEKLVVMVTKQPDRFRGQLSQAEFLGQFEQHVSYITQRRCDCISSSCQIACPCRRAGRLCTFWCAGHSVPSHLNCTRRGDSSPSQIEDDLMAGS